MMMHYTPHRTSMRSSTLCVALFVLLLMLRVGTDEGTARMLEHDSTNDKEKSHAGATIKSNTNVEPFLKNTSNMKNNEQYKLPASLMRTSKRDQVLDVDFVSASVQILPQVKQQHVHHFESQFVPLDDYLAVVVGAGYVDENKTRSVAPCLQFFNITSRQWIADLRLPDGVPATRQGIAFDELSRWLYIIAGRQLGSGCMPAVKTATRVHVDTQKIEMIPELPHARYSPYVVTVPVDEHTTYLHVFGGTFSDREDTSYDHWRLKMVNDTVIPEWQLERKVIETGPHGIVFQRNGSIYHTAFSSHDVATRVSNLMTDECHKQRSGYVAIDTQCLVPRNGVFYRYDAAAAAVSPNSNAHNWIRLQDMPFPLFRTGLLLKYGRVILFGGVQAQVSSFSGQNQREKGTNIVQAYDFGSDSWEVLSRLPEAMSNAHVWSTTNDDKIYLLQKLWNQTAGSLPSYHGRLLTGKFLLNSGKTSLMKNEKNDILYSKAQNIKEMISRFKDCIERNTTISLELYDHLNMTSFNKFRASHNHQFNHLQYPDIVARPSSTEEVSILVQCSKRTGYAVCGRNGKHSYVGDTCTNGVVVDVTRLNKIQALNRSTGGGEYLIGAGNTLGKISLTLYKDGVALPSGHCASVGITGLILAGGQGPLSRMHGLTCDKVSAMEYVNSDGDVILAKEDSEEYADALWLAKGGGGRLHFPGIITAWYLRNLPKLETPLGDGKLYIRYTLSFEPTLHNAERVMSAYQDFFQNRTNQKDPLFRRLTVEGWIALFPGEVGFSRTLQLVAYSYGNSTISQIINETYVSQLEGLIPLTALSKKVQHMDYLEFQRHIAGVSSNDELSSGKDGWNLVDDPKKNLANRWQGSSVIANEPVRGTVFRRLAKQIWESKPLAQRYAEFKPLGGAIQGDAPHHEASAFWHRNAFWWCLTSHFWHSEQQNMSSSIIENSRKIHAEYKMGMGSAYGGSYAGYMEHGKSIYADLVRYNGKNADRILQVTRALDPHNLFRHFVPNNPNHAGLVFSDKVGAEG